MRLWNAIQAAASGVEDDGSFDSPEGPDECEKRRAAAFRVRAEELALADDWGSRPYGVVLEIHGSRGVTTIIAFATGESSLLLHASGSGMIGRPSHVHVVTEAKRLVKEAARHVSSLHPATSFSYPPPGSARFYVLTSQGVLTHEEAVGPLRAGESPLAPLMEAGDELMSEFLQYFYR